MGIIRPIRNAVSKSGVRPIPGYWKEYRAAHPKQAERNRVLQQIRNRKRRAGIGQICPSASQAVKMDAYLIAKMDALKVNIYEITASCP
ncbi:MAG: hypothetical protein WA133_05405 [Syntrophales bacterium]